MCAAMAVVVTVGLQVPVIAKQAASSRGEGGVIAMKGVSYAGLFQPAASASERGCCRGCDHDC